MMAIKVTSVPETRIYAATTGNCLAGDCTGRPLDEEQRIAFDFRNKTRFVVDRGQGEIRCFIPAKRRSAEAFYAVHAARKGESLGVESFIHTVMGLFEERDDWAIRSDTVEGEFLHTLESLWQSKPEVNQLDICDSTGAREVVDGLDGSEAARHVYRTFGQSDDVTIDQYVISLVGPTPDFDPDVLIHLFDTSKK